MHVYVGDTSLILASLKGHLEVVRFLVDRGADIHAKNNYGKLLYIFL